MKKNERLKLEKVLFKAMDSVIRAVDKSQLDAPEMLAVAKAYSTAYDRAMRVIKRACASE